jgi:hypothetical protein
MDRRCDLLIEQRQSTEALVLRAVPGIACLPGVTVEGASPPTTEGPDIGFRQIFLAIEQLADHDDANSAHFRQQLVLWHRDEAAPVALTSSGYSINRGRNEASFRTVHPQRERV